MHVFFEDDGQLKAGTVLADNEYTKGNDKVLVTAKALAAGYVPWVFHFADMVNSDSSPWIGMLQQEIGRAHV